MQRASYFSLCLFNSSYSFLAILNSFIVLAIPPAKAPLVDNPTKIGIKGNSISFGIGITLGSLLDESSVNYLAAAIANSMAIFLHFCFNFFIRFFVTDISDSV